MGHIGTGMKCRIEKDKIRWEKKGKSELVVCKEIVAKKQNNVYCEYW